MSVARQGALVFGAEVLSRGIRFGALWALALLLGAEDLGRYAVVVAVVAVVGGLAPLGLDVATMYFVAKARGAADLGRVAGVVRRVAPWSGVGALVATGVLALVALAPGVPAADDVGWAVPVVGVWGVLLVLVGILRGLGDMRAQAVSFQIVLPVGIGIGAVVGAATVGLSGALAGWGLGVAVACLVAAVQVARRVDLGHPKPTTPPAGEVVRFAAPQALETTAYRATEWVDLLVLAALIGGPEVGAYRVALALALVSRMPAMAANTVLSPRIAAELSAGRTRELEVELRRATWWLAVCGAPVVAVLVIAPDLPLALFADDFAVGSAVAVLCVGQLVDVVVLPTARLVPMSGRSAHNLALHLVVLAVNLVLDLLWIPEHGALGAAAATSVSLVVGAVLFMGASVRLTGVRGWDLRTVLFLCVVLAGSGVAAWWAADLSMAARVGVAAGSAAVCVLLALGGTRRDDVEFIRGASRHADRHQGSEPSQGTDHPGAA